MTPRQPSEIPDDDKQSELLRAVHRALNDLAPANDPPAAEMRQVEPTDETEVEIDRIEAYLRGPTAFTA